MTGCDRAGPRAPARQMDVRLLLCLVRREKGIGQPAKPRFPQKPQFGPTAPLVHSCSLIFFPLTHPRAARSLHDLLTVQLHTGAARSRPSDGCSTFTVPCQEGKGNWATSQTIASGGSWFGCFEIPLGAFENLLSNGVRSPTVLCVVPCLPSRACEVEILLTALFLYLYMHYRGKYRDFGGVA